MSKTEDKSLKWCYIGDNKEYVMMTCTREDWEKIRDVIEWARKRLDQDLARESDEVNYSYTYSDWRHEHGTK